MDTRNFDCRTSKTKEGQEILRFWTLRFGEIRFVGVGGRRAGRRRRTGRAASQTGLHR